jgi:hypothetical protein
MSCPAQARGCHEAGEATRVNRGTSTRGHEGFHEIENCGHGQKRQVGIMTMATKIQLATACYCGHGGRWVLKIRPVRQRQLEVTAIPVSGTSRSWPWWLKIMRVWAGDDVAEGAAKLILASWAPLCVEEWFVQLWPFFHVLPCINRISEWIRMWERWGKYERDVIWVPRATSSAGWKLHTIRWLQNHTQSVYFSLILVYESKFVRLFCIFFHRLMSGWLNQLIIWFSINPQ